MTVIDSVPCRFQVSPPPRPGPAVCPKFSKEGFVAGLQQRALHLPSRLQPLRVCQRGTSSRSCPATASTFRRWGEYDRLAPTAWSVKHTLILSLAATKPGQTKPPNVRFVTSASGADFLWNHFVPFLPQPLSVHFFLFFFRPGFGGSE